MEELINSGCFNLRTVDEPINFGEGFTKLKLSSEQRADMSMFLQQVPSLAVLIRWQTHMLPLFLMVLPTTL